MIAQGSAIVNLEFFNAMNRRLESIQTCAELHAFMEEMTSSLNASIAAIGQQLAIIGPILELLTAPGIDPSKIVTWITKFIAAFIAPYAKPYITYAAQLAALSAAIGQLAANIQEKASELGNCSVSPPVLPGIPDLPPMPELPPAPPWPPMPPAP